MRQQHKEVFFRVADQFNCWIGLREPNELADRWIGRPGYRPKGETCKAKTADNPAFRFSGLVADPTRRPEAFLATSLASAVDTWTKKFTPAGRLPVGFTVVESGPEAGLVKHHGDFVYADYDLMTILGATAQGKRTTLTSEEASRAELHRLRALVEPALNRGFGVEMIQHGPEFDYRGIGARQYERVLWFGPGRRFEYGESSMPHVPGGTLEEQRRVAH